MEGARGKRQENSRGGGRPKLYGREMRWSRMNGLAGEWKRAGEGGRGGKTKNNNKFESNSDALHGELRMRWQYSSYPLASISLPCFLCPFPGTAAAAAAVVAISPLFLFNKQFDDIRTQN